MSYEKRLYPVHVGLPPVTLLCKVADTLAERTRGLQDHARLGDSEGMYFPYRGGHGTTATLHMGRVSFPIDLVFARDEVIVKIVRNIAPGTGGGWSFAPCTGVLEVRGGWCLDHNVDVGSLLILERPGSIP